MSRIIFTQLFPRLSRKWRNVLSHWPLPLLYQNCLSCPFPWAAVFGIILWIFFVKCVSHESSICLPTLLDTLPTVGDALSPVTQAQDVVFVVRGTEKWLCPLPLWYCRPVLVTLSQGHPGASHRHQAIEVPAVPANLKLARGGTASRQA